MENKNHILEIKMGERTYQMIVPMDAPIGEIHDVMYQFRGFILDKMLQAHEELKLPQGDLIPAEDELVVVEV